MNPSEIVAALRSGVPQQMQMAMGALFPGGSMLFLAISAKDVAFLEAGMPGGRQQVVNALLGMGTKLVDKFGVKPEPPPQDKLVVTSELPKALPDLRTIGNKVPDKWPPE